MGLNFFEIFPDVNLRQELKSIMSYSSVEKVTTNSMKTIIKVYLVSERLIDRSYFVQVEKELENQLFSGMGVNVSIIESFNLSTQYNSKNLFDAYEESIMSELYNMNKIMYQTMKKADVEFEENHMRVIIEDLATNRRYANELHDYLDRVFNERCKIPTVISIEYKEHVESKYAAQRDEMVKRMARTIFARADLDETAVSAGAGSNDNIVSAEGESKKEVATANAAEASVNGTTKENVQSNNSSEAPKSKSKAVPTAAREEKKSDGFKSERNWSGSAGGFRRNDTYKKSDNPDVLYGREFEGDSIDICDLDDGSGEVIVRGQLVTVETREIRNERTIFTFSITDFTDTIKGKMFIKNENLTEILDAVKPGVFVRIKAVAMYDSYDKEVSLNSVVGVMKSKDTRVKREDLSIDKRVELHCHTKMSDMDGVSDAGDIIKQAIAWGHSAIAITDHGCVQGFTDALHALQKIEGYFKYDALNFNFKIIYGVEAYLVDDLKTIVTDAGEQTLDDKYVVFDIETTGFSASNDKIIEIGAVKVENGVITERFSQFVNPEIPIPIRIEELTTINDTMVKDAPTIDEVLPKFLEFAEGAVMVAHNADFDMSFIIRKAKDLGIDFKSTYVDTVALSRAMLPNLNRYKLDTVAKALDVKLETHHRAVDDAGCTAEIFVKLVKLLKNDGITSLKEADAKYKVDAEIVKKLPSHHAIILAKNETGRKNLYRLVSLSHLTYFHRQPRIPKSEYLKYSEGLIIGSACEAGELYQAVYGGKSDAEIARLVDFYDYLEIQPLGNNQFMIDKGEATLEQLKDINKEIVKLGEKFDKPVVATCDVHFLNPEDEVYRRIIMAGKGFDDADNQAPLFLRTTEEMLAEFQYLGSDKAEEVVITNTNKIADMIEKICPVSPRKAAPVIENSDQLLRDICYNKAHSMYGENLPEVVEKRLERELNSIISNGYAVMYIIAQKLVWKSNEDGYLVGSRGSVGSSFVATMSGITEVNPLSPHYYCEKCHFSDFDSPEVKAFAGGSGCDMPDRNCPECGEPLVKAGFDIPFETFLGFKGNKEPDIDLNFSGEYQSKAHEYTEVIFGKGQTYRAGTIGTLADKTAFGYVKHYFEERNQPKRTCEVERIVKGCVGVRRTTGQHPGGIIVLPYGDEIYEFTPIQHPANDMTVKTITTHFDYHSIDHNLLKLDILGHDDPTMIRMLEDLTGVDALSIPFDDQKVMSLFANTEALGVTPADLGGCPLGSLGIPEFGTDFVIQMLIDTKPKTLSDLIRISGLSHGTDVWLGNAQTLIAEGKATISTAICTRDDIMVYLINKGLESELSFTIMESVRKGKGLKPEWEEEMLAHDVPDWYIWSCKKIKYMFPKAHAAAYVMMAFRIAYFKVYYPLAYYAAYFSIRASAFDYEIMCQGKDKLNYYIDDYNRRDALNELTKKEQETKKDMRIVQEMYARGFEFEKIDLEKVSAHRFQIMNGKLMPALSTIEGLGDKAADQVVDAVKDGPFISKDNFRERTKVSKTVIDTLADLGILENLPESSQLSMFDFNM